MSDELTLDSALLLKSTIASETFSTLHSPITYEFSHTRFAQMCCFGGTLGMFISFSSSIVAFGIPRINSLAVLVGVFYVLLSGFILIRSCFHATCEQPINIHLFASLFLTAGGFSIAFSSKWLNAQQLPRVRILMFSILVLATNLMSFLSFLGFLDVLSHNLLRDTSMDHFRENVQRLALFDDENLIWHGFLLSALAGLGYGYVFAHLDQMEESLESVTDQLSLLFALPLGFLLGAFGAGTNEHFLYLRFVELASTNGNGNGT
jgi:hypothetical protein